jgi:hypothetical protein
LLFGAGLEEAPSALIVKIETRKGGKMNNCKDWTMKNVIVRASTPIETKNCTNVELPKQEKK